MGNNKFYSLPIQKEFFAERRIDNVRTSIGSDPHIKKWIETHERYNRALNRQMKDVAFGEEFTLRGEALDLFMRAAELERALLQSKNFRRATE